MGNIYENILDELISEQVAEENIEKKAEELCHNLLDEYSIKMNNKNQTIMNTTKLSKAELDRIAVRFNQINSAVAATTTLPMKEALTAYYLAEVDGLGYDEAKQTIERLMEGVNSLTEKYQQALAGDWNPKDDIDQITVDMTLEQRYDFLVNAIAIAQSVNAQTLGGDVEQMKTTVEQAVATLTANHSAVTEETCKELQVLLCQLLESSSLMLLGAEQAKELMEAAGKGEAVDFAASTYDDYLYKYQMALAAWIEFQKGELESFPDNTIPEAVGVSIAAGVEEAKIVQQVSFGRKCVEWGVKCLKILGGVALVCLLGYVGIMGMIITALSFFSAGIMILGSSTCAIIVAGLAALLVSCGISDTVIEVGGKILTACSNAYDYVVEKLRDDIFPAIKEMVVRFVNWVRSLFSKQDATQGATN